MLSSLHHTARAICALSLLACASERNPTAPGRDSAAIAVPLLEQAASEPSPEELAELPAEFQTAPSIFNARTEVEFTSDGVYARGTMDYFATDAEQDVTLTLRRDDREVYSRTARDVQEDFFPAMRSLSTIVSFGVDASCGNSADGSTAHRVWHKFIVGSWKYFSWGRDEEPSGDGAEQPACPEPAPPPTSEPGTGGGGGDYDTGCVSCQQWFWYEYGQLVDEWWECTPVDAWRCESLAT